MTQLAESPPASESGATEAPCCGLGEIHHADAFRYLEDAPANAFHAVVTDPPYGLLEYTEGQLAKLRSGNGGVWRMPPALGGYRRRPVPRFTVLTDSDKERMRCFFDRLAQSLFRVLTPGAHVFIAANPLVSYLVYEPFVGGGFEKRGEVIRAVTTLRGGDRPKNAGGEFPGVTVMPRSAWEPWGLFRKPIEGRVQDNLRKWKTGALRRPSPESPFRDLIQSAPAPMRERAIAPHPSLKPQRFMRQIVHAALPLGEGVILDPFMGAGSTIAAADALGLRSVGVEVNGEFFAMAAKAIPELRALKV